MTMIMESPPSKREAFRRFRSERAVTKSSSSSPPPLTKRGELVGDHQEDDGNHRVSRRKRLEMAKAASARWQSGTSSRKLAANLDDNEEEEVDLETEDHQHQHNRRRGGHRDRHRGLPRRTASLDEEQSANIAQNRHQHRTRPPLQRNKSSDGTTLSHERALRRAFANNAVNDRNANVMRRYASSRMLMGGRERQNEVRENQSRRQQLASRSRSERRLHASQQISTTGMDNNSGNDKHHHHHHGDGGGGRRRGSSSTGNSGDRRRRGMSDDSSNNGGGGSNLGMSRRRLMNRSMSSSFNSVDSSRSGGGGPPTTRHRRRKPRGAGHGGGNSDLNKSMNDLSMKDQSADSLEGGGDGNNTNTNNNEDRIVIPGKGMDDNSRRRKEPTLSKLSIDELRKKLGASEEGQGEAGEGQGEQGEEGEQQQQQQDGNGVGGGDEWDVGNDAGPLSSDLNFD